MELIERIPTEKIAFIKSMDYKKFKEFSKKCKNEDERKVKFNMMKAFCTAHTKARGEIRRIYSYTQTTPLEVGGRLYCGNSIQGLQKDFRGFLMDGITTDVDMKNAHPVILRYLCKKNNILCPNLSYYIDNRDEVLRNFDEDGKTLFLCAVNDDKLNKKCSNQFFKDFDKECKMIQRAITSLECYKHIVDSVPATRLYNFLGSAINRILCVYENKIIQQVVTVVNSRGIEICALMFDGILLYGNHYVDETLLTEVESVVNEAFDGLNMKFAYKEHTTNIEMPDDFEAVDTSVKIDEGRSFDEMAEVFEKTHCKIRANGVFIEEKANKINVMSRTHLVTSNECTTYDKIIENGKTGMMSVTQKNFIHDWLVNNDNQREYDEMECYPDTTKCPSNCYNTWRPFAMELVKDYTPMPEAVDIFRKHIKILCGNDDVVATYIEAWIAQMIQYPAIKSICPTLISKPGAGKGTLMLLLSAMLGKEKYFETTTPSRDVFGQFNGHMSDSFLVNFDELCKKEMMGAEGQFKALTTNPSLTINEKGVKSYKINSYHRFIITSNSEEPISSSKDDRRNLIIRSSDELIGDKDYFNDLYGLLDDVDAMKSCYEYFKSIPDMDKFGHIPMPKTEYQEDIKQASVSPIELWLIDFAKTHAGSEELSVSASAQYTQFMEWCGKCGIKYEINNVQFSVRLKRLSVAGVSNSMSTKSGNKRIFNIPEMIKHFKIEIDTEDGVTDDDTM